MLRTTALILVALTARVTHAQNTTPPATAVASISGITAGSYDLDVVFGGGTLNGKLDVAIAGDSLTVKLFISDHQSPVRAGTRKGNRLTLESTSPALQVRYELEFTGENVKGTFTYDGESGSVSGRRRSSSP